MWKVLRKCLHVHPYHLQLLQALKLCAPTLRLKCCSCRKIYFLDCVVFSDESTFHLNGIVNTYNVRIWGSENPCEFVQCERDTPKLYVFCAFSPRKVYGPFFFVETNITGMAYRDMLQEWLFAQLQDEPNFVWQQDGTLYIGITLYEIG